MKPKFEGKFLAGKSGSARSFTVSLGKFSGFQPFEFVLVTIFISDNSWNLVHPSLHDLNSSKAQ